MARGSVIAWRVWEALFKVFAGVKPIRKTQEDLFLVADRRYLGRSFTIDGIKVKPFDRVLELHINNELVMDILKDHHSLMASTVKLLSEARDSLPALAEYVENETGKNVRALYGVTFIHRGISRLGFSSFPISNRFMRELSRWHLRKLFEMVNPGGTQALTKHRDDFVPRVVAISKDHLLELYHAE
ncbi:polysaccharide deacetylase [Alicyclobacillus sp. SO9]|uniref:YkoP family protein n=1 Tax=Alicyclobacillus sp. SO9 TaxID=2665646 RepID=UPI0018E82943|nr:polysaccharide deacetylase [Alicyclobacillus sp. SO9]QQE77153.1 polysaccharide deacetylase [Alicyclobacillus sp. SO9]